MKSNCTSHRKQTESESGVALLIAIFVLLLVSVVGISLIVASGGESSLEGNYRSSASAYLAGTAGLEEARGRLLPKNADYFNTTVANFIPTATPLAVGQVRYVLNPAAGETLANLLTTYPDNEYTTEGFAAPVAANVQTIASVATVTSGGTTYYGPRFKWVRITPATEQSIKTNVNNDATLDSTTPLYYDPTLVNALGVPKPSLFLPPMVGGVPNLAANPNAKQALEITTLAVLPGGTQKMLQYVVAPVSFPLNFPSALTLAGNSVAFSGANSNQYFVDGKDGDGNPPAVAGCTPGTTSVPAIGTTGTSNVTNVDTGIPRPTHYTGGGLATPSVSNVGTSLNSTLQSPAALDQLIQTISNNADVVINGNATNANLPSTMSATNPETIVVNGDFSMSGNFTGYGLIVVTGNFSYSGTTGWAGIVLVVGKGTTTFNGSGGGNNEFDGAIYTATTRDAAGNTLSTLGNVAFDISGGGGNGIYYNSCWVNQANQAPTYQVLSFRELH